MSISVESGWFDLGAAAKRSSYRLPLALRLPDEGFTHCDSFVASYGDPAVDPRSGGVIGIPAIAAGLERSEFQTRRILQSPVADSVRWVGDLPATNVQSLAALKKVLETRVREAHCPNLKQFKVKF